MGTGQPLDVAWILAVAASSTDAPLGPPAIIAAFTAANAAATATTRTNAAMTNTSEAHRWRPMEATSATKLGRHSTRSKAEKQMQQTNVATHGAHGTKMQASEANGRRNTSPHQFGGHSDLKITLRPGSTQAKRRGRGAYGLQRNWRRAGTVSTDGLRTGGAWPPARHTNEADREEQRVRAGKTKAGTFANRGERTCRMLTAVLPGVRRTAAAVTTGGAHQRSRPPKAAAAAESETLPRAPD